MNAPAASEARDKVDYVRSMLKQLQDMARAEGNDMLAYLIEMAHIEANDIVRGSRNSKIAFNERHSAA
ncbi:MAG: hypothetical protein AB7P20_14655 [Rhizobiaceae bacterium]